MDGEDSIRSAYASILDGDFEAAIEQFEAAIALEPHNADYHYKCSITCARSGKWSKALAYAETAVQLSGAVDAYRFHLQTVRAKLLLLRAEAQLASSPGDASSAILLLEEAVTLDPLLLDAFLLLGTACGGMGRYAEATAWLKAALELDPNHAAARKWYAEYRRKLRSRLK